VVEVKLMRIFDRWGELVFEESNTLPNNPFYGWNGSFRGKLMEPAVFVYYILVELYDGTVRAYQGNLHLVR
jgi:CHU_C Type IX secretion signal domain